MNNSALIVEDIEIELVRKRVKRINVRVYITQARVRVTAPLSISNTAIQHFVEAKMPWIKKHLEKTKDYVAAKKPQLKLNSGEEHFYQGQAYTLQVLSAKSNNNKQGVKIESANDLISINAQAENQERYLFLYSKHPENLKSKQEILDDWYRQQLKLTIKQWVDYYQPLMKVRVKEIGVKKMKTRWGTCNIQAQRIWLNFELIKRRPEQLEYVVAHEMVHLLEASHNHRFQSLMTQFMPAWRDIKAQLNQTSL